MSALQAARFDEAKREFAAFLKIQPKHFGALNLIAVASMQLGHLADAEAYLSRAIAINPRSSSYFYVLATIYRKLGKAEESRKAMEAFVKLDRESNELEQKRREFLKDGRGEGVARE